MEFTPSTDFISKDTREHIELSRGSIRMSPWIAQNVIFEILQDFMLTNDPKELGYTFDQKYSDDKTKSNISLEIAYDWKADSAAKRPAVFIYRGDTQISYPTMGHMIGRNVADSEDYKMALVNVPITVNIVAGPVGFVEQLADYVRQPLMYYSQILQKDFGFNKFRLNTISKPNFVSEAKDNFTVELSLQVIYTDGWVIKGDDLKLKTFSAMIIDNLKKKPLENQ